MTEDVYRYYVCPGCGQEVLASQQPESFKWSDGHVCNFVLQEDKVDEVVSSSEEDD